MKEEFQDLSESEEGSFIESNVIIEKNSQNSDEKESEIFVEFDQKMIIFLVRKS